MSIPPWGCPASRASGPRVTPLRDAIDVQLVAFPQAGLLTRPGTAGLLEDALRQGVEVVGGIDPRRI